MNDPINKVFYFETPIDYPRMFPGPGFYFITKPESRVEKIHGPFATKEFAQAALDTETEE